MEDQLFRALVIGNTKIVEDCIHNGVQVNQQMNLDGCRLSPLHIACTMGHPETVSLLLRLNANIDAPSVDNGETPVYMAAEMGHCRVVEILVKAQANVDLQDAHGRSPLYIASQRGHDQVVQALLRAQASASQQAMNGRTPLCAAVLDSQLSVVSLLIKAQAGVDIQEFNGYSSLHIASERGHHQLVAECLKSPQVANVDLQSGDGATPLFIAAKFGRDVVVEMLIEAGADVNLQQESEASPLHIASHENYDHIVDALIRSFADVNLKQASGATPLYIASQCGNHRIVSQLIAAQAGLDIQANTGCTAVYIAAQFVHGEVVETLVRAGADVNLQAENGSTPMYVAAESGLNKLVKVLIEAQANVNLQRSSGESPLYIASENGHHQIVETLIGAQADVDMQNKRNYTPLYTASQQGHLEIVISLIKAKADVNLQQDRGASPIHGACQFGYHHIVNELIKAGADFNLQQAQGGTPLFFACQMGHGTIVDLLINARVDADLRTNTGCCPLYIAAEKGHYRIVEALVKAQADVNIQRNSGETALYAASQHGHFHVVDILIRAKADVNISEVEGFAPIHIASQNGHHQVVNSLIKANADIDLQNKRGSSALFIASQRGQHLILDALVKAQANVNLQQSQGATPIHVAAQAGRERIVKSLVNAGAIVDLRMRDGRTALHFASHTGHCHVIEVLLGAWTDVNLTNRHGESPLYIASQNGHCQLVEALIKSFADLDLQSNDGETPLDIAKQSGHAGVVQVLMRAQATFADTCMQPNTIDSLAVARSSDTQSSALTTKEDELGMQLHSALGRSGFKRERAALQSAVAAVLQEILRRRGPNLRDYTFVVGSFSEGWGNSLQCANGRTDAESDIDVMQLTPGRLYHLKGQCSCTELDKEYEVECTNGHISIYGFASSPARPELGSGLRPAVDRVSACRLCSYPPIAPLQPDRVAKSNIPQPVLESLRQEISASLCHVVHATAPGQSGKQLRVSTTFLERRLLQSLTTLQGQLFVTLKYLVKKVISQRVEGLKAYHAKTVTFCLLEETPAEHWQPENLVSLVRRALQILHDSLEASCRSGNSDRRIMDHFFVCDAALYLKGAAECSIIKVAQVLRDVINELPQLLGQFITSLKPVTDQFIFHPFLILPILDPIIKRRLTGNLKYHEIYDTVRDCILMLSDTNYGSELLETLQKQTDRLPDCARSAREALRALVCLKFGNRDDAAKILRHCSTRQVTRGIAWSAKMAEADANPEFVWKQLRTSDCAWNFCFCSDQSPTLSFLPQFLTACFPKRMGDIDSRLFYVNFDALLKCLTIELGASDDGERMAREWLEDVTQRDDADVQELLLVLHYCSDRRLATRLLLKHRPTLLDDYIAREHLRKLHADITQREVLRYLLDK